jgi:hypothetical protein
LYSSQMLGFQSRGRNRRDMLHRKAENSLVAGTGCLWKIWVKKQLQKLDINSW